MPAPILAVTGVTSTVANVAVANTAADGTMDVQYGIRPDFELCVCPLVRGVARGNIALGQLNAGTTYYVRVRSRRANGAGCPSRSFASGGHDRTSDCRRAVPYPFVAWRKRSDRRLSYLQSRP